MIVKMTNKDIISFWNVISGNGMAKHFGAKFLYAVSKNRDHLKSIVSNLADVQSKKPDVMKEFDEKRIELCKEYADKDENGNPVIVGSDFSIKECIDDFDIALDKLKEEYKDAFDELEKYRKEFESLLDEELEVDIHMVHIEYVPDTVTNYEMSVLSKMIKE